MKNIIALFAIVVVFSMSCSVEAEGGCPPGQYPQSGQGWQTCVPVPENTSGANSARPPQVTWEERFGAVANDSDDRASGAASGRATEQQAITDASPTAKHTAVTGVGKAPFIEISA